MGSKLSPVIIVVLLIVAIALGVLIFSTLTSNNTSNNANSNISTSEEEVVKPVLNLSKKYEGDSPKKVTITASATPNEGNEIKEIVLPDGTSVMGDKAEYEVDENGEYEFTAVCIDGVSDSLTIKVTEIAEISADNPYIPDGFTQVEGTTVETGFVIEDEYGNQYVWVPVSSGKLTRNTMLDTKFEESATTASALVNSVAKYYGFYIGRYEASQYELDGQQVAASMAGKIPWTNINYQDAASYANSSYEKFGYEDCYTAIVNSYAWDTTLGWIDESVTNYSTTISYGNYSGTIYPTGTTESDIKNEICDIAGNVREWTTEIYKDTSTTTDTRTENAISRVIRGGAATLNKSPASGNGYPETQSSNYWGFRLILYK
jgi:formylglycine-generating enzyme required for sulfatase activity